MTNKQRADGSFAIVDQSGEVTAPRLVRITLHAFLLDVLHDNNDAKDTASRLAKYLLNELHDVADALSDTDTRAVFHALASLYEYDAALITPDILAAAVKFLVAHELAPGGPYRNALTSDVDVDTNVSIRRFVCHFGGPFPKLDEYIAQANKNDSRYFTAAWPRQQMLAATYRSVGDVRKVRVTARPTEFFCKDPNEPSATYGMSAIIETLSSSHNLKAKRSTPRAKSTRRAAYNRVLARAVAANANNSNVSAALTRIMQIDHNEEIGLLALRFASALVDKRPTRQTLETLGAANLYNWVAYSIYDDFLDDEGEPRKLPVANVALRTAVRLFKNAVANDTFDKIVDKTFDAVDAANAWELAHCRFAVDDNTVGVGVLPDYDNLHNLYERSLTHSLPILGTLAAAGFALNSKTMRSAADAFKQYLIIRQLNDDLHDWQEDLRAGHISYVVAKLLDDAKIPRGTQQLTPLIVKLEQTFLYQTLPAMCANMLVRATQAHRSLVHAALQNPNVIDELIDRYEQNAAYMLTRQSYATAFVRAYK